MHRPDYILDDDFPIPRAVLETSARKEQFRWLEITDDPRDFALIAGQEIVEALAPVRAYDGASSTLDILRMRAEVLGKRCEKEERHSWSRWEDREFAQASNSYFNPNGKTLAEFMGEFTAWWNSDERKQEKRDRAALDSGELSVADMIAMAQRYSDRITTEADNEATPQSKQDREELLRGGYEWIGNANYPRRDEFPKPRQFQSIPEIVADILRKNHGYRLRRAAPVKNGEVCPAPRSMFGYYVRKAPIEH